jgi:hypothetical protein
MKREQAIEVLVSDCIIAHQEAIIVKIIAQLEEEYEEIAALATMGEYQKNWTHDQVLDYITYDT